MTIRYLCLESKQSKKRLLILDQEALDVYCRETAEAYRISPIFPVLPKEAKLPKNEEHYVFSCFIIDRPYSAIGTLLRSISAKYHPHLWFTHGLCSLVVFSKNLELPRLIKAQTALCFRGMETWKIQKTLIKDRRFSLNKAVPFNGVDYQLNHSGFPQDVTSTILELTHCLNTAVRRSAQFLPNQLEIFRRLAIAIRDILTELRFLHHIDEAPPESFSEEASQEIRRNPVERQRMIHQRIGHLVQINSALSYVVSQAFAGTIPLFESDCQTRLFSLFGIGSAYRALSAFSRFTESIFQKNPVDDVIATQFQKLPALRVQTNPMDHHSDVKLWDDARWSVDTYLSDLTPEEKKYNLVYFSGRLGFRESEFAITAALQVLTNVNTASWSIMTFSHEMMHAHVRGLLSAIFADTGKKFRFQTLGEILDNFISYLDQSPDARIPANFLESIRFQLLSYCGYRRLLRNALEEQARTGELNIEGDGNWEKGELAAEFSVSNREINEIFVHVLDFNYFYNGNARTYLALLWQSWLPVPVVLDDVQNYVWRSLLSLASQQAGDADTRFRAACDTFISTLTELNKGSVANVLIKYAIEYVQADENQPALLFRFQFALPLVDLVQKFLCSAHIHAELFDDENATEVDGQYVYAIETGQFKEIKVVSPVALAADRLRRALRPESNGITNPHAAAWFFLMCGECTP